MKKTVVLFLLCALPLSALSAQITVGADGGFNYTLGNLSNLESSGYKIERTAIPASGEAGYRFNLSFNAKLIQDVTLVAGIRAGTLHLLTTEAKDHSTSFKLDTIPLHIFARAETGWLYATVGLGAHFWNLDYEVDGSDLDAKGTGFSLYLSPGVSYTVFELLTVRAGPTMSYFSIPDIGNGTSGNSISVGASAGFSLNF